MNVVLYGADWCGDCVRSKRFLKEHGIKFVEHNIVTSPERADEVVQLNIKAGFGTKRRIPVILIGEKILSEPSNDDLAEALGIAA
ncbi:MAG: glutaredoxin family protein [bacterium]|nr:glutaredoxin family protein [bacterium]